MNFYKFLIYDIFLVDKILSSILDLIIMIKYFYINSFNFIIITSLNLILFYSKNNIYLYSFLNILRN